MARKRRIPSGNVPEELRGAGRSLENEVLALALEGLAATQHRLRQRRPEITLDHADELDAHCRQVMKSCFEIVASTLAKPGDQLQAQGLILKAYPWIDTNNLEEVLQKGLYYAK
jgi:hypothetical protein